MTNKDGVYETDILTLMPYLQMHGLKYLDHEVKDDEGRLRVVARFVDPRNIGSDLAMSWNNSDEKQYRDWWTFFRNEIDKALKEIK